MYTLYTVIQSSNTYFKAIWRRIRWRSGGATLLGLSGRSGRHGGGCRENQISGEAAQD